MIHPAYVEKKMTILVQDRQRLRIWGPRCYGVWLQGIPMYPMYPLKKPFDLLFQPGLKALHLPHNGMWSVHSLLGRSGVQPAGVLLLGERFLVSIPSHRRVVHGSSNRL